MTGDCAPSPESPEERLERGELIVYGRCPFALPQGDDLHFLREQRLSRWAHKNVSYDPHTGRVTGFRRRSTAQADRLRRLLADFSSAATDWLAGTLPRYAHGCRPDRASLRPEEEATRRLRLTARNDLLHMDAFPTRPTLGDRILRLFININPTEPRVWVTSEPFARLLPRYGHEVGLPGSARDRGWVGSSLSVLLRPFAGTGPSNYDRFMLRFHNYLKLHDDFQERCPKRFWSFPPGSMWLAFTDGLAHAELRGQFALEQSYFIAPGALALPDEAPAVLLARLCGSGIRRRAA